MKPFFKFFDHLEDYVRSRLSHYPITYAVIGGIGVVLFWRGIWDAADWMEMPWPVSILISVIILLVTGLFVSFFVGEDIILTGINRQKKLEERTEEEIKTERDDIDELKLDIREIKHILGELNKTIGDGTSKK